MNLGDSSSQSVGLRHLRMEGLSSTSGTKVSKGNTGLKERRSKIKGSLNIRQFDLTFDSSNIHKQGENTSQFPPLSEIPDQLTVDGNFSLKQDDKNMKSDMMKQANHNRFNSLPSNIMQNSQPYEIQPFFIVDDYARQYEDIETIGEGGAAVVKRSRHKEEDKIYATKVMRRYDLEKEINSRKEFELIKSIPDHPNVIKAKEFIATDQWTYTVMECAPGIELQDFINKNRETFDTNKMQIIKNLMTNLLEGIKHLHSQRICHKDIKPENIMVDFDESQLKSLKIVDFNISQKVENEKFVMISANGTRLFIAPEMQQDKKYNEKIDLWGAGVILTYLLFNRIPNNGGFTEKDDKDEKYDMISIDEIQNQNIEDDDEDLKQGRNLLLQLVQFDPVNRPSADDALKHDFLKPI